MPTTTSVLSDLYRQLRGSGPPVLFISGASGDAGRFAGAAARFAGQLGLAVGQISGHHVPSLDQPKAFAEELRPILRELA
jgi:pimeloyl-ACP methyl ester carboxylesterase